MPAREAQYRNTVLNQRVEASTPFVSVSVWKASGAEPVADFTALPVWGGLDLADVNDLAAMVWVAHGKVWHVRARFWLPEHDLREKAQAERVPYDLWRDQGYLHTTPGKTIEYEYIAQYLFESCSRMDVRKIAFDPWNFRHLKPWLKEAGFKDGQLEGPDAIFELFGQGYKSMSPALRVLESDLLNANLAHGNHPVLTMCAANAVVLRDPARNRKLTKEKSRGRIDGMVALTMARSIAEAQDGPQESVYQTRGLRVI